jgi:DNA-directed RNA polymerase subunit RPC12/RpoP
VQDQLQIFVDLLDHLSQYSEYSLLHFGNYEAIALRRIQARIGEPYRAQIENVLKHSINVLSLIRAHVYFPTYSNSLKDIGSFLGYQWSVPSSTGVQTLVWRSRWLSDRDASSKANLVHYNNDDCAALRLVVEFLEQVAASGPTTPFQDDRGTEVVRTSGLSAKSDGWSIFGETKYVLDEFRFINKLSYFDYQRDKVFARTGTRRRKPNARKIRRKLRPNETETYRASKCPACQFRGIAPISQTEYDVEDLRFTRGGVRRWITRHVRYRYICKRCGTRFLPTAIRGQRKLPKHGRGLIAWCMYQLLIGGQNINRIHRSLTGLFGLSIPKTSVYLFKQAVAAYFREGYERI